MNVEHKQVLVDREFVKSLSGEDFKNQGIIALGEAELLMAYLENAIS